MAMNLIEMHCFPVEPGAAALTEQEENGYLKEIVGWELVRQNVHSLRKQLWFGIFTETINFFVELSFIAQAEGHHPDFHVHWNSIVIELRTRSVGGLSENDFFLAANIDALVARNAPKVHFRSPLAASITAT